MTPNEKAKQLIKEHLTAIAEESMDSDKMMFYSAKQCAIVTVKEFIKEFRELLIKFKAEICIEDFGSGYNTNEKIVIDFEWDEDLSKRVESGIVEQLVIGRYENGR